MKQLKPTQSLDSLWPSRFLKPYHLLDNGMSEITDTIKSIVMEETEPRPDQKRLAPVLYFERIKTPYLLSAKTDRDTLQNVFGVRQVGQLIGLRITLHVTEWQRRAVLRIKPVRPPAMQTLTTADTDSGGDIVEDTDIHDEENNITNEEGDNTDDQDDNADNQE
ncbi:MAG: hypothetical protein DCC55_28330 [Chloroflexi bacterium]|nr:MAG: hypothetical protein DCC55_28330 [Chloroflexota bacterium]